ncbi:MAG: hemolysin family protein [Oligoflexia bacterium]|nr:hemolysin family protein [Oligoflexia bacterium]
MSMNLTVWHLLAIIPPLLLLEGFFSGSEIALLSADKLALKRLARQNARGAKLALELASHPERIFSTTLLMTSLCVIGISSLMELYFLQLSAHYPFLARNSSVIAVLTISPLIVILGELVPKTVYQRNATSLARWVAYPVHWTFWGCYPLTRLLSAYTARLSRIVAPIQELITGKRKTTREEIRALLSYTRKETEIKTSEKQMIKRIFDFKNSEAKHALIPLVRVEAIEDTSSVREALERFERHRHSRMPVYSERIDNIMGILEATDLAGATDLSHPIRNYVTTPHYVAETQSLEDLLREMRSEDNEMAVVVDEHGGAVGVLTFEDIVEEIVGEISDEYDSDALPYKALSERKWLVQARMEIQQINDALKLELPHGDYETLSGFLLQQFGRIPETRDELFFNTGAGSYKFTIRNATQRHIESVLVEKLDE